MGVGLTWLLLGCRPVQKSYKDFCNPLRQRRWLQLRTVQFNHSRAGISTLLALLTGNSNSSSILMTLIFMETGVRRTAEVVGVVGAAVVGGGEEEQMMVIEIINENHALSLRQEGEH
jgi:hypothetical protein